MPTDILYELAFLASEAGNLIIFGRVITEKSNFYL